MECVPGSYREDSVWALGCYFWFRMNEAGVQGQSGGADIKLSGTRSF